MASPRNFHQCKGEEFDEHNEESNYVHVPLNSTNLSEIDVLQSMARISSSRLVSCTDLYHSLLILWCCRSSHFVAISPSFNCAVDVALFQGGLVWSPYAAEDSMDALYPDLAQVS